MELHLLRIHRDAMIPPPAQQGFQVELLLRDLINDVFEATVFRSFPARICRQLGATIAVKRGYHSPSEGMETKWQSNPLLP